MTDLTGTILALETRLASQTPLMDDDAHSHRQLNELHEFDKQVQTAEKSIEELLQQSKRLGNERLLRLSEQLISRWKQIYSEIHQRFEQTLATGISRGHRA